MLTSLASILLAAGLLLIIVGLLGGGIEIKEVKIPPVPALPRAASFVVGCILLGLVLWDPIGLRNPQPQPEVSGQKTIPDKGPELGTAITNHLIDVHDVKKVLEHLGMYAGQINDEHEPAYFQAVAKFQQSRKISQDGLVGAETLGKLKEAWPEYFGLGNTPSPTTPPSPNSASKAPSPQAPATPAPAPKSNPLAEVKIYSGALRILYVEEQKDFAEKLRSYLSSKGYSASAIYDDFSEINKDNREKPKTIKIVYKSTAKNFEPTLVQAMRDKFPSDMTRLVESLNDSAAFDLQIQLW
jgi:Putative peptidoglycan binding domain